MEQTARLSRSSLGRSSSNSPTSKRSSLPSLNTRQPVHRSKHTPERSRSSADIWPPVQRPKPLPRFRDPVAGLCKDVKFRSVQTYVDQTLREALHSAGSDYEILPDRALTATACHCLSVLSKGNLPFSPALRIICDLLFPAIYLDRSRSQGDMPFEGRNLYYEEYREAMAMHIEYQNNGRGTKAEATAELQALKSQINELERALAAARLDLRVNAKNVYYKEQEKEKVCMDLAALEKEQAIADHEVDELRKAVPEMKTQMIQLQVECAKHRDKAKELGELLQTTTMENIIMERQLKRREQLQKLEAIVVEKCRSEHICDGLVRYGTVKDVSSEEDKSKNLGYVSKNWYKEGSLRKPPLGVSILE